MNAPIDVTDIRIETERLILRPWQEGDLADFYKYSSVPGVGEMAGWTHHEKIEQSETILRIFIQERKTLALVLKENGKAIGSLGIEELVPDPIGEGKLGRELGYVLSKDYWGRGLMPEAVQAVINYAFQILGYDYLTCSHFASNEQSRRVIQKCGFTYVEDIQYPAQTGIQEPAKLYILWNSNKE